MTRLNLKLKLSTNSPVCWGVGFVAMDIVEAESGQFAVAGGSCGNVMALLAWLGWSSIPVARLGTDAPGKLVREELSKLEVKTDFLTAEPSLQTPIVIQRFSEDSKGQRVHRFSLSCPECGGWLPRHRPITLKQAKTVVEIGDKPKAFYFDRLSPGALKLAEEARRKGALVVFEPASLGDESRFQKAVDLCHILKFAHDRLGHIPDLARAKSPRIVIETLGRDGLRVRWRSRWTQFAAVKAPNFVDAAGSGDWCTAGLIHVIGQQGAIGLKTLSKTRLSNALQFGQALAAVNCGFEGARGATFDLTHKQMDKALSKVVGGGEIKQPQADSSTHLAPAPPDEFCKLCTDSLAGEKSNKKKKKRASA